MFQKFRALRKARIRVLSSICARLKSMKIPLPSYALSISKGPASTLYYARVHQSYHANTGQKKIGVSYSS